MTMPVYKIEVDFSRPQSVVEALRLMRNSAKVSRVAMMASGDDSGVQMFEDLATILQAAADTAQDVVTLDAARI